jgi:hypothetical protein
MAVERMFLPEKTVKDHVSALSAKPGSELNVAHSECRRGPAA